MTGRLFRGRLAAACAVLFVTGVACTSGGPVSPSDSVSGASQPPRPADVTDARFTGRYQVTTFQIQTNVAGTERVLRTRWRVHPRCIDGFCDAIVNSIGAGSVGGEPYRVRALFVDGSYRWTTSSSIYYWCQPDGAATRTFLQSVAEYTVDPVQMAPSGNLWVVTRLSGTVSSRGLSQDGCERPEETYAIRGVRLTPVS